MRKTLPHRKRAPSRAARSRLPAYITLTCLVVGFVGLAAERTLNVRVIPLLLGKASEPASLGAEPVPSLSRDGPSEKEDKEKEEKKDKEEDKEEKEKEKEKEEEEKEEEEKEEREREEEEAPEPEESDNEGTQEQPGDEAPADTQENNVPEPVTEGIEEELQTTESAQAPTEPETMPDEPESAAPSFEAIVTTEPAPNAEPTNLTTQGSPTTDAPSASEPLATTDAPEVSVASVESTSGEVQPAGEPLALAEPAGEPSPEPDAPALDTSASVQGAAGEVAPEEPIAPAEPATEGEPEAVGGGGGGGGPTGSAYSKADDLARIIGIASIRDYIPPRRPETRSDDLLSFVRPTRRTIRRLFGEYRG